MAVCPEAVATKVWGALGRVALGAAVVAVATLDATLVWTALIERTL